MPEDQLKAFWEAIQADASLQQRLQGITDPDAVVGIAKDAGFVISAGALQKLMSHISDEDLESVSAGDACLTSCAASSYSACGIE
jgi:predicted ribosomally synthesized peptide with nif11-like leader